MHPTVRYYKVVGVFDDGVRLDMFVGRGCPNEALRDAIVYAKALGWDVPNFEATEIFEVPKSFLTKNEENWYTEGTTHTRDIHEIFCMMLSDSMDPVTKSLNKWHRQQRIQKYA